MNDNKIFFLLSGAILVLVTFIAMMIMECDYIIDGLSLSSMVFGIYLVGALFVVIGLILNATDNC